MVEKLRVSPFSQNGVESPKCSPIIEAIAPDKVVEKLRLSGSSPALLNSINESGWGQIDSGKTIIEVRKESVLTKTKKGEVNIYDFDDCLMSATGWHKKEYERLKDDEGLHDKGIYISSEEAKEIYDMSKILVPRVAEKEKRYTPRLNLILLSVYSHELNKGKKLGYTKEEVWQKVLDFSREAQGQVNRFGEDVLEYYYVNPQIEKIFSHNPPKDALYEEFVQYALRQTRPEDIRIILTRGKIEGALGQVYKVHLSGLMKQKEKHGQSIDMAIYSNDLKADALVSIMELLPDIKNKPVNLYDDNPSEITPYLQKIRSLGAENIKVIQVGQPNSKRNGLAIEGVEYAFKNMVGETTLTYYSPKWRNGNQAQTLA